MIRDLGAYRRIREAERWRRLSEMSIDESLAVGEALLTSELMLSAPPVTNSPRPLNLAHALGLHGRSGTRK